MTDSWDRGADYIDGVEIRGRAVGSRRGRKLMTEIADILRAAKQRIETLGWWTSDRNRPDSAKDGVCAAIAICDAWAGFWAPGCSEEPCRNATHFFVASLGIERKFPASITTDIGAWNDAPGRTKAEVLAAFDRAIYAAGDHATHDPA